MCDQNCTKNNNENQGWTPDKLAAEGAAIVRRLNTETDQEQISQLTGCFLAVQEVLIEKDARNARQPRTE